MFKPKLYAVVAMSALLTACQGGQSLPPPPAGAQLQPSSNDREFTSLSLFEAQNVVTGEKIRVLPTKDAMDAFRTAQAGQRATQATSQLTYHGGVVQTNPKMYVVFWGPSWNTTAGDPDGEAAYLKGFLKIIGGSGWLNTVTQYTDGNGNHVGNQPGSLAGTYVDAASSPPSRPTQSQLAAEAARAAAHFGNYTTNADYIVALPHGIVPSGFGTQYCAYHSSTTAAGHTIAWTNDPYFPDVGASCGAGSVNNPGTLDGVSIVAGKEQAAVETDPFSNTGWLDSSGAEISDKCSWTMLENNPTRAAIRPNRCGATPTTGASSTIRSRAFRIAGTRGGVARVEGSMEDLVLCPCGHAMGSHDGGGCAGDRLRSCHCRRDRYRALDAAVDEARARPWISQDEAPAS